MRITFVLPGFISVPMGGVKVVHEYANRLSEKGHVVSLVYPIHLQTNFRYLLKKILVNQYDRCTGNNRELYYTPNPKVSVLTVKKICDKYIPDADAVIAAGWQTAEPVSRLPDVCGKKFYLLQHFETYFRSKKQVLETFHLPMKKIAIAQWIINELKNIGQDAEGPIGNAIDHKEFYLEANIPERTTDVIAVYHYMNVKGPRDLITTLKNLKKRKNISATVVSARKPIHRFPVWVKIIIRPPIPELRKIYSSSKVFLHTSHSEGWGLPVLEAMACGCAVVATENRGVKEYLIPNQNAMMVPIGDTDALTTQVNYLLTDYHQRKLLVENGLKTVSQFSWKSSVLILENILLRNTE
ncbi:MAG: glycosyltransferase family 4 protein [Candidatus Marinimicrobia bacterium]|nr:glycosyltransferase family 4 protein [Candidatus Neomarinimicrobiota bacterium]